MKVGFVVQRYGPEIRGGAEAHCREMAERLAERGIDVEVFTTCATDYRTWRNELKAGTSTDNRVVVHRFATVEERHPRFDEFCGPVLDDPEHATPEIQETWMDMQGPQVPDLVTALKARSKTFDVIIFVTYLYWTTYHGLRVVRDRAVLQPTAHDEKPIHLPMFDDMFRMPKAFIFLTEEERRFVDLQFGTAGTPTLVAGIGVEGPEVAPRTDPRPASLPERYIACLGRVDTSKGVDHLCAFFSAYRERRDPALELIFVGDPVATLPDLPGITVAGQVDDARKWEILANATALVHPSFYESFALSLLEGWTVGTPAVVNGFCDVTVGHCRRSGGGVWYRSYAEFEACLDRLLADDILRSTLARQGAKYVDASYRWKDVTDSYVRFLEAVRSPS